MKDKEPFKTPYTTKWGFTLEQVEGYCTNCDKPLVEMRGKILEFEHCVEIRGSGVCHPCKLLVHLMPTRVYDDNRFSFLSEDGVWHNRIMNKGVNKTKILLTSIVVIEIICAAIYLFWK